METKEKTVEFAYSAEDVYDALKQLTDDDDDRLCHGLFKIEAVDEETMKVSYIEERETRKLRDSEINDMLISGGWMRYYNDYYICAALLKYYSRL